MMSFCICIIFTHHSLLSFKSYSRTRLWRHLESLLWKKLNSGFLSALHDLWNFECPIREPLLRKNVHILWKQFYDINRFIIKLHLKEFCAGGKKFYLRAKSWYFSPFYYVHPIIGENNWCWVYGSAKVAILQALFKR